MLMFPSTLMEIAALCCVVSGKFLILELNHFPDPITRRAKPIVMDIENGGEREISLSSPLHMCLKSVSPPILFT